MKIPEVKIITAMDAMFPDINAHYVTVYVFAPSYKGKLTNKEPDKMDGWGWYDLDDLPEPLFENIPVAVELLKNMIV